MSSGDRVIVLVDMDCFYVQVEQRLHPEYKGKPCAVVQYKEWRGGSIVAVSYEARDYGVKRGQFGDDAKEQCPECHLFRIPEKRGKGDLTKYRDAGAEVIRALSKFTNWVERASVDEAYLDITDLVREKGESETLREELSTTHVATYKSQRGSVNWFDSEVSDGDKDLAVGATIVSEMRRHVLEQTQFHCSAGIARNKCLAKLACGLRKPDGQTILPYSCVQKLFEEVPVEKMRNLGGKLGHRVMETLDVKYMGEVYAMGRDRLRWLLGEKEGDYIFAMSEGTYEEEVRRRLLTKSISCSKNFLGPETLKSPDKVKYWLKQMSLEIVERVADDHLRNKRRPQTISLHFWPVETKHGISRAAPFPVNCADRLTEVSWMAMTRDKVSPKLVQGKTEVNELSKAVGVSAITSLGMSACNFAPVTDRSVQHTLNFNSHQEVNETDSTENYTIAEPRSDNDSNSLISLLDPNSNPASIPEIHLLPYPVPDPTPPNPHAAVEALKDDITATFFANCPTSHRQMRSNHPSNNTSTEAAVFLQSIPFAKRVSISHLPSLRDHDPNSSDYVPFNYRTNVMLTARGIDVPTMHCLPLELQNDILVELEEDTRLHRHRTLLLEDYSSNSSSSFGFAAPKKEVLVKCVTCGEMVVRSKLQEHKDYHFARAVEEIPVIGRSAPSSSTGTETSPPASKKRKSGSTEESAPHKKKRGRKKRERSISRPAGQSTLSMFLSKPSVA